VFDYSIKDDSDLI